MRYIQRKTNVRKHNRQNKYVVATVRNHDRNLKPRRMLGVIPLKNLRYKQAKAIFPTMEPYGDIDEDGVVNKRDCRPFDVDRQDEYDWEEERARRLKEAEEDNEDAAEFMEKEKAKYFHQLQEEGKMDGWDLGWRRLDEIERKVRKEHPEMTDKEVQEEQIKRYRATYPPGMLDVEKYGY